MNAADLVVKAPRRRLAEFSWVCETILAERLGLTFRIEPHGSDDVVIQADAGRVEWRDVFFASADSNWLSPTTLPDPAQIENWRVADAELARRVDSATLPIFFGEGEMRIDQTCVRLPADLSGTVFFMLSRYEEAVSGAAADRHGRFPGSASVAHRAGLARRPLVDECVELLWWALQKISPGLVRKPLQPSTWVSCDLDAPFSPSGTSLALAARQIASHLVNDRSPRRAGLALLNAAASRLGNARFDAFDCHDWMQDRNERVGNRITYYVLSLKKPAPHDCCYELTEPRIAALLARIVSRGHEIGLHGSYGSAFDPIALARELAGLKAAASRAASPQTRFGARQHYLRWRTPATARSLAALDLAHDSTLGFSDVAGFRCGTCHPYQLWDVQAGAALNLVERPLALMEVTVTSPDYLNLGLGAAAVDLMRDIKRRCAHFGGEFSLLWHNSNLTEPRSREIYEELIGPPPR